jgi:hypothetical protein
MLSHNRRKLGKIVALAMKVTAVTLYTLVTLMTNVTIVSKRNDSLIHKVVINVRKY